MRRELTQYNKVMRSIKKVPSQTTKNRHHFSRFLIIGLIISFAILTFLAKLNPYFGFDLQITRAVQQIQLPLFGNLMQFLTDLGLMPEELVLPVLVALFLVTIKQLKTAILVLFSTYGVIALSETLKRIVERPRPDSHLINQVGQYLKPDSFPSGHVLFFIGFFGFLAYLIYTRLEKTWLSQALVTILLLMILLIGVSRIYLGAHWFSDVLGSYLVGTVWLYLMIHLVHRFKV